MIRRMSIVTPKRNRLAANLVLVLIACVAALLVSAITPLVWHDKFYIDGLTILSTVPSFEPFGGSYAASALLLKPWFAVARAVGGDLTTYGLQYGYGLIATNIVFGSSFLATFMWFTLRFEPLATWRNYAAVLMVMVLLAPFYFAITKELVLFLSSTLPFIVWSRSAEKLKTGLFVYFVSLLFLGIYFRSYYALYGVVLLVNLVALRRPAVALAVYGIALLVVFATFSKLPWDLLLKGRAEYLEGISASRIEYYFSDGSFIGFVGNRVLTFLSMMFPVNLAMRSPAYMPFIALQLWLSIGIIGNIRRRAAGIVGISTHVVLAFTIVQALFEPDYGSYFRHKVGLILFILVILCKFIRIPDPVDRSVPGRKRYS